MSRKDTPQGTDNVLLDLGFDDAEELSAKAALALKLNELIDQRSLSQTEAAHIIGMTQPKVSQVRRYKLQNISLERLMQALVSLDQHVEIIVQPAQRKHAPGMSGRPRELAMFEPGDDGRTIVGRVAAKGLADELHDRGYLVIDGVDGKAHYVALNARDELANYPTGAVVEVKGSADVRAADKNIAALASDGLYRADHHLAIEQGRAKPGRDPQEVVAAHVRRLEALRRAGIVERVAEGLWKVPDDLAERGRQYDAQRLGGVAVELKSHLPIERQARVIGATWLDQQLIGGGRGLGDLGFGGDTKQAMQQRADFLAEQGLAERRGQRVNLARNLLGTLRNRELAQAAKDIAAETGLEHRPIADGQRVAGIYRRSVMLASGRYAMLDDGMGFSLVPWRPVIEQRLGQQIAATVRGGGVSWDVGRHRGLSV